MSKQANERTSGPLEIRQSCTGNEAWIVESPKVYRAALFRCKADAELFVAADGLLAALKRLSQVATWDDDTDRAEFDAAMTDATAAIEKAEGR